MISGTIKASQMKLSTVIGVLRTSEKTKLKFKKSYPKITSLLQTVGKFGPPQKWGNDKSFTI